MLFIQSIPFSRAVDGYLTETDLDSLESELIRNPEKGVLIQGSGGARKLRIGLEGRGKRGGGRVIYYYRQSRNVIRLLDFYAKNKQESLSATAMESLREQVREAKESNYP